MASKLLDKQRIPGLHAATIEAGLEGLRTALLQGIDASFVASLPVSPAPSAQILTDLYGLNLVLADGSVPLGRWLENAFLLAGPRAAGAEFEAALVELGLPVPARATAAATAIDEAPRRAAVDRTDVVIFAAVQDELEAVLALGERGREGWDEKRDLQGFPYFRRTFSREDGSALVIAAAWIGAMGQDVDTALRGQQLVAELGPACLAMCGICGGWRKKVALGDIVVADQLYVYDHGKLIAGGGPESGFYHHIEGYGPGRVWKMDAAFFAQAFKLDALARERPLSLAGQRGWLLRALHAHETEGAEAPEKHPDRKALVPAWKQLVPRLREEGLVAITGAKLSLTEKGLAAVGEDLVINIDGAPSEPKLRVHVGAMATGRTVRQDPTLFDRLVRIERATIAVDMEGAAVAKVAEWFGKRSLVVKAVSDHADDDKDDRYRAFACKASATFLLAFLLKHLEAEPSGGGTRPRSKSDSGDHESFPDQAGGERRGAGFLDHIEQICELRWPGAHVVRHATPYPFAGALEIIVPRERIIHRELLVALEQGVTGDALAVLAGDILPPHRRYGHIACKLVHLAPMATPDLALRAQRREVELVTFESYQGLIDFSRYTAWLSRRLELDQEYPPWLYVEQPAGVSFATQKAKLVPNALASLREVLDTQERRFALILGDFGAGKSFLLRELARRLLADRGALVPVLVEMRSLEKTLSLRTLLAQHFTDADVGSVDIDAFLYMLHEGRVVLLFDGFDELAVRVTYDQVLQHFATITSAVEGKAKVIISSRRQHFLDDGQVTLELARNAEQLQGYRLLQLQPFGEPQIRQFLRNRLKDDAEASARYRLIHDVKDLLGLSHNPRMLSFIADLEPARLTAATEAAGEITPAKLYELLLDRWLEGECSRTQVKKESLWGAVRSFARTLWATPGNAVDLARLPRDLVPRMEAPKQVLSEEQARLVLGSRSLLKRDADGMFSFVHRSVLEWLVASEAVSELEASGNADVLDADAMSPLMARFFVDLAGKERAEGWARRVFAAEKGGTTEKNALQVAGELGLEFIVNLEGRDLRGVSLIGLILRGANLRRVNLEGVVLRDYDFTGADLTEARLARADLGGATLSYANLSRADLSFARLLGANVSETDLTGAILVGAKLLGVKGLSAKLSALAEHDGAAVLTRANVREIVLPPSECNSVAHHPDGHVLASGHDDGTVRLWNVASGKLLYALSGHLGNVLSVAFSPDGRLLASGSADTTVRLWDTVSGTQRLALAGHTGTVRSIAFSPDGRSLASGSRDTTVRLWDVASGSTQRRLFGHTKRVSSVAFSPDGQSLATGSHDTTVRLWDTATGIQRFAAFAHPSYVQSVAFSPDDQSLASGAHDSTVRLWDIATGTPRRALSGHTNIVSSLAFSPDGRSLASGSHDKTVRLWDIATGTQRLALSGHTHGVSSVAFSPDGRSLASSSDDGTIRLWDVASGHCLAVLLATTEGWVSFVPEDHPGGPPRGAFKMGGDIAGSFWHRIGLARFEPGELDEFLPEGKKLRLPDDYAFLPPR